MFINSTSLRAFRALRVPRAGLAFALALALATAAVALRAQDLNVDVANMRQEIDMLRQRVGQLELNVESLQRDNGDLRASAASSAKQNFATVDQLNKAIADINRAIKDSKADTLARVATQMDSLAKKSNDALNDMAAKVNAATRRAGATPATGAGRNTTATSALAPVFSDNYPKDGISYAVVSGDSLARIAKKTGAKIEDIKNANKIANEKALQIGQVLFIPGGRDSGAAASSASASAAASAPASTDSATPIAPAPAQ